FHPALTHATGSDPSAVAVGDFNGDGFPDLAVANAGSNSVSVLISARDWSTTSQASSFAVRGFPSSTTAGVSGTFTVTVKTASGDRATGYTGTVHFTSSDGKASLPANYIFTAADAGIHTFRATLKTAGTQSITARDTVTGTITGTEGGIRVKPAAASKLLLRAPAKVRSGVPFSLTVTVKDSYGNAVTGYTGTMHLKSTGGTVSLPPNHTFTAADKGVHTFACVVLRKRGNQRITVTDTHYSWLTGSVIVDVL
ncbi:MAG TPA: FG-GAP repeat protein, partial [Bryobacteraceae bacterium]|nr:FG-GAP repeat protein [Bryobacteraceae bacterium]